jgi:PKD repeat protein
VRFDLSASDRERNISEVKLDFGDGSGASDFSADELPRAHAYSEPGRYTAKLTVTDFYLRRATATVTVTVEAG